MVQQLLSIFHSHQVTHFLDFTTNPIPILRDLQPFLDACLDLELIKQSKDGAVGYMALSFQLSMANLLNKHHKSQA
jgi:hypothetical protein